MNAFDTRLANNLFPEMPDSFARSMRKALNKAGVQKSAARPWRIIPIAAAATAVAASLLLVITGLIRGDHNHAVSPDGTPQGVVPGTFPVPRASAEPDWQWNTQILATDLQDSRYTQEDAERCGRCILSFLHEIGESEPDELWIIRMKSTESFLPRDDTGNYMSCVLVLAQSRFGESDGPDLYCIQGHADGEVLWGTIDGAPGPHRVLAEAYGQQRWVIFGTNTESNGASIGHIQSGYLTGGEPGTDVEFGALLTTEESRKPFAESRHLDRLTEYYLVTDGGSDPESLLNLSLLLITSDSSYAFPLYNNVPELQALTAAEAAAIRKDLDALTQPRPTPEPGSLQTTAPQASFAPTEEPWNPAATAPANGQAGIVTSVVNLTDWSDDTAARYTDAIAAWLKSRGTQPKMLWLCAKAPFAFPEEDPTDEAYLLAQYEFEGETGPELFYYRNGTILWQTTGYDPFAINTVYDPIRDQFCVFGASRFYDNGPVPVKDIRLYAGPEGTSAQWSDYGIVFSAELPLSKVQARLSGTPYAAEAREFFLCPYGSRGEDSKIYQLVFEAYNGDVYAPAVDAVNNLVAQVAPGASTP